MAFLKTRMLVLVLMLVCFAQSSEARKLLGIQKIQVPSLEGSLVFSALPKGSVPSSTPSNKGHAAILVNEKHFSLLPAHVERNLGSVPAPGIGH